MGTFRVEIEIGDATGERWETVEALVDTWRHTHATPSFWQTAGTSSMTSAEAGFV